MGQRILAVEIGDGRVRAALADRSFKSLDLLGVYEETQSAEEPNLGAALTRLIASAGTSDIVISALPAEFVAQRLLTLPFTDRRKLQQTVPFALEEHLPFAVDDAAVAFARVGREDSNSLVIAAFARKEELRRHLDLLAHAGLDPKTVTLSSLALAGFLARSRNGKDGSHLVLEIDEASTSLVLIDQSGTPRAMRTIGHGLNLRAPSPSGTEEAGANAILRAVRQTLLSHSSEDGAPDLVLAGSATAAPAVRAELATALEVPVRDLSEFDYSALIQGAQGEPAKFAGCFAMLLGEAADTPLELLNFRQGEFAYRGSSGTLGPLRLTAALGAGLVAVALLHLVLSIAISVRKLHLLNGEIANVTASALPASSPATARVDLQGKLTAMNKRLRLLGGNLGHGSPLDVLLQVSRAIPVNVPLQAASLQIDDSSVKMDGKVDSFVTVDHIKGALERGGGFGPIQVEHAGAGADNSKVEFRLSAQLKDAAGTF
ncbi:MAG TPA: type II secretion system protein GspL [Candidatus Binataceae bacterium]|nr:type II secretion system protein GspL [Candidatus Binataceae bacterium]